MYLITPKKTPNQRFGVTILGVNYSLETRLTAAGIMMMNVSADGEVLVSGVRCCPNQYVLPYDYMTKGGNFYWSCDDDEYPDYTKFNDQHKLYFLTDAEILEDAV